MKKISIILLLLLLTIVSYSTNYYFSTTDGDDSRTPLQAQNQATPWKTIAKFNSYFESFTAGDEIFFKSGDVFPGSLTITFSDPISISAYGTGAKPVINGFETITGWTSEGGGIYSKAVTVQSSPNMVTVNGVNTPMGRFPNSGYLTIDSHVTNTTITDADLNSSVTNWTGAEVVIRKWAWVIDRSVITNHSSSTLTYTSGSPNNAQNGYGYFIQNDLKCLDVLGEWVYNSGKLYMFFGANSPSDYTVNVSVLDKGANISSRNALLINGLSIEGFNVAGISLSSANNISIYSTDINYSGYNGIEGDASTAIVLLQSTISNSNNKAISLNSTCTGSSFTNNTITNTGQFAGMGNKVILAGSVTVFSAIVTESANTLIENNSITNSGYLGVFFAGNNITVNKNYIDTFCTVADDGGGIYTTVGIYTGRIISNNIVINGVGAGAGKADATNSANGIYLDYNASNSSVTGNTIYNCSSAGLYIHNGHNNTVTGNTIYNNSIQFLLSQNSSDDQIRNNAISSNIFAAKDYTQVLIREVSSVDDILSFGTFAGNYYIRPFGDDGASYMEYSLLGKNYAKTYSIDRWIAEVDVTGIRTPLSFNSYTVNSIIGTQKFTNGTFTSDVSNFGRYYTGTSTLTWDNTNKITAGTAKYAITALSTDINQAQISGGVGVVSANAVYKVNFKMLGSKSNRTVKVKLIETASPYRVSSEDHYTAFSNSITSNEIFITSTLSLAAAKLYFYIDDDDVDVYFDDIEVYEVDATNNNPDSVILFDYNTTQSNKVVNLPNIYKSLNNTNTTAYTLLPFVSTVLLKDEGAVPDPTPSTSTGKLVKYNGKVVKNNGKVVKY